MTEGTTGSTCPRGLLCRRVPTLDPGVNPRATDARGLWTAGQALWHIRSKTSLMDLWTLLFGSWVGITSRGCRTDTTTARVGAGWGTGRAGRSHPTSPPAPASNRCSVPSTSKRLTRLSTYRRSTNLGVESIWSEERYPTQGPPKAFRLGWVIYVVRSLWNFLYTLRKPFPKEIVP